MFRTIEVQFEPIEQWPGEKTVNRRPSPFRVGLDQSYRLLESELLHLGVSSVVIQMDCDRSQIRRDGLLRTDAKARPGVIVSFTTSLQQSLSYPCDRFDNWADNIRAIALALEALRKVDRYGVSGNGEQYRGWLALPSPNGDHWTKQQAWEFIATTIGADPKCPIPPHVYLERTLVTAERKTHPDTGGNPEDFKKVQQARELLLK